LIALGRRKLRIRQVLERAQVIPLPADVVAEWWRVTTDIRSDVHDLERLHPVFPNVRVLGT